MSGCVRSPQTAANYSSWDYRLTLASHGDLDVGDRLHAILRPLEEVTAAVAMALGETSIWEISYGAAQGGGWRIGNTPGKGGVREEEEPEIDMPPATPRGAAKDDRRREPSSPLFPLLRGGAAGATLPISGGAPRRGGPRCYTGDPARKARSVHLGYDDSRPRWTPACGCEPAAPISPPGQEKEEE